MFPTLRIQLVFGVFVGSVVSRPHVPGLDPSLERKRGKPFRVDFKRLSLYGSKFMRISLPRHYTCGSLLSHSKRPSFTSSDSKSLGPGLQVRDSTRSDRIGSVDPEVTKTQSFKNF